MTETRIVDRKRGNQVLAVIDESRGETTITEAWKRKKQKTKRTEDTKEEDQEDE